jgi:wyosine [tRNA(Phe)-imidazoG37] synthetase (radical SAM superfamily)
MRRLDFSDHRRELDTNRYVYAVVSRRVGGLSIGINLNPDKVCNFSCPYCQVDRQVPGGDRAIDLVVLEQELDDLLGMVADGTLWTHSPFDTTAAEFRRVGDISFAGDGEPTAAIEFADAVSVVTKIRNHHSLDKVRLSLLTNATLFQRPKVKEGLDRLHGAGGEVWAKLDAGTEAWFHRVDGTKMPFQRVLDNLLSAAQQYGVVVQSMFHTFAGVGPSDPEIESWAGRLGDVLVAGGTIRHVQVYSVARRPSDSSIGAVPLERLEVIAGHARQLGLDVSVYPGVDWT